MPKKKTYRTLFIACEGSNTEPNYLGRMAEAIDDSRMLRVNIFPKPPILSDSKPSNDSRKSDPVGLVELAQNELAGGAYDEAWAVFDQDGHNGLAEAFKKAQKKISGKTVRIAFSSIAFEHWILLHFEKNLTLYEKSAHLIESCFYGKNLYPQYGKNRLTDPYPFLAEKTFTAIENAAWLRHQQKEALSQMGGNVFQLNPYTNMDELVKVLLGLDLEVSWTNFNQKTVFAGYELVFSKIEGGVSILFTNHSATTCVFNAENIENFFLTRPSGKLTLHESLVIAPGESKNFQLECSTEISPDFLLIFKLGHKSLYIAQA
jgi:hypothetical protein